MLRNSEDDPRVKASKEIEEKAQASGLARRDLGKFWRWLGTVRFQEPELTEARADEILADCYEFVTEFLGYKARAAIRARRMRKPTDGGAPQAEGPKSQ